MQTDLSELKNADANYAAALARAEQVSAELAQAQEVSRKAQTRATVAQTRVTSERTSLTSAQRALTDALATGKPLKELQDQVSGHRANIESLETLLAEAREEAIALDQAIAKAQMPIGSADQAVREARFALLVVQLAKAIVPAIPLARELDRLSHSLSRGMSESGYLFDLSRPKLWHYTVADDGSLSFHMS
jgi:chromosome segregation ATPase